jgi:hypothetical protein
MTNERHLERDLPAILGEIATGRYPDYIDDVLTTTARRRQRPAWTFPERWLAVELVTSRVGTTRMPWRQVGVLALIALLLAAALAVYIGSGTPHLPAPFGPADNGAIVYARNRDIVVRDSVTSAERILVGGPTDDHDPGFSPDGTSLLVIRTQGGRQSSWLPTPTARQRSRSSRIRSSIRTWLGGPTAARSPSSMRGTVSRICSSPRWTAQGPTRSSHWGSVPFPDWQRVAR